jgi:hypothetical protein
MGRPKWKVSAAAVETIKRHCITPRINMDLYDLNLKNTNAKPAPSLSQMQQQQTKSTGNSLW